MAVQAQHAYRDLLRTVRKHAKGDHFSDFISQKFRDNVASKDVEALQKNVALAKDYGYLVKSIHAHKMGLAAERTRRMNTDGDLLRDLLISYNIGVDREVEQAARLKDTANRVGLSMPKLFEEDSK